MHKPGITAHMIVKNEDQWVWFAIQSVLPYVDNFLITDTGSTDRTLAIIRGIKSSKIHITTCNASDPTAITSVRQSQIDKTTTEWMWVVDADEIYSVDTATEIIETSRHNDKKIIVVRRYDLLGDVYHRQRESVGTYHLFGQSGHLLVRLVNLSRIQGVHMIGDYPLEGLFDEKDKSILDSKTEDVYITRGHLFHAMYLKRSSLGSNLLTMVNRHKFKIEKGQRIKSELPLVFSKSRPEEVPNPLVHRSFGYEVIAAFMTPIKELKRNLIP